MPGRSLTNHEKNGNYRSLLTAQIGAGLSQWLDVILIFSIPVFLWKGTPQEMAFVASSFALPGLLLGPVIGTWLDRGPIERFLLAGALMRILGGILLFWCASIEWFYPLVILKALGNTVYWGASNVLVNRLFSQPLRERYFPNLSIADQLTKILAPLMVGGLHAVGADGQALFLLPAGIAGMSLLMLAPVLVQPFRAGASSPCQPPRTERSAFGQDLLQGVQAIRLLPASLKCAILAAIGASACLAIYDPHLPTILQSAGHAESAYAILVAATAVGAATGGLIFKGFASAKRLSYAVTMRAGLGLFCGSLLAASLMFWQQQTGIMLLCAAWFIGGLGYELLGISHVLTLQAQCPPDYLGRISTLTRSIQLSCISLFPLLGSTLMGWFAPFSALVLAFVLTLALWWLLVLARRRQ